MAFTKDSLTPKPAKHCRQAEPAGDALAFAVQMDWEKACAKKPFNLD
jgi:hypothetical protein